MDEGMDMEAKVVATKEMIDNWNVPNIEAGFIIDVEEMIDDDGFYWVVNTEFEKDFWMAIPANFIELLP